jgi:hypothetical protein
MLNLRRNNQRQPPLPVLPRKIRWIPQPSRNQLPLSLIAFSRTTTSRLARAYRLLLARAAASNN